ncbi:VOC family protein [Blastococcus sp. URHD0036]|uniref:VOC family protein n=1 Tax=Blastococcus sp. URHD0036 TaxID=1380356 RepID=UPI00049563B9|nr:VOC family protein [Blastococcus sp. URHD0036]
MRTLHVGLRVADPDRALAFYEAVGYEVVGQVPDSPAGDLTMLKLPDDEFVSIELVHDASVAVGGSSLSHLVIQVESMAATVARLQEKGLEVAEPSSPDGSADFLTSWITDPDGNQIELVQWPAGHAVGMSAADWA